MTDHPATYSASIMAILADLLSDEADRLGRSPLVLDPFGGVGRIHEIHPDLATTISSELQRRWAAASNGPAVVADATRLPFPPRTFDVVMTSPCYGNRMADTYDGSRDRCVVCGGSGLAPDPEADPDCGVCGGSGLNPSRRRTYTIAHGSPLHPRNAGAMQWGDAYRELHRQAWTAAATVLRHDGLLVVNISNHIRGGKIQRVAEWHLDTLLRMGLLVSEVRRVDTPRYRDGANREARVDGELVLAVRRPPAPTTNQGELFDG